MEDERYSMKNMRRAARRYAAWYLNKLYELAGMRQVSFDSWFERYESEDENLFRTISGWKQDAEKWRKLQKLLGDK